MGGCAKGMVDNNNSKPLHVKTPKPQIQQNHSQHKESAPKVQQSAEVHRRGHEPSPVKQLIERQSSDEDITPKKDETEMLRLNSELNSKMVKKPNLSNEEVPFGDLPEVSREEIKKNEKQNQEWDLKGDQVKDQDVPDFRNSTPLMNLAVSFG